MVLFDKSLKKLNDLKQSVQKHCTDTLGTLKNAPKKDLIIGGIQAFTGIALAGLGAKMAYNGYTNSNNQNAKNTEQNPNPNPNPNATQNKPNKVKVVFGGFRWISGCWRRWIGSAGSKYITQRIGTRQEKT